jgi:hypothetical protein
MRSKGRPHTPLNVLSKGIEKIFRMVPASWEPHVGRQDRRRVVRPNRGYENRALRFQRVWRIKTVSRRKASILEVHLPKMDVKADSAGRQARILLRQVFQARAQERKVWIPRHSITRICRPILPAEHPIYRKEEKGSRRSTPLDVKISQLDANSIPSWTSRKRAGIG